MIEPRRGVKMGGSGRASKQASIAFPLILMITGAVSSLLAATVVHSFFLVIAGPLVLTLGFLSAAFVIYRRRMLASSPGSPARAKSEHEATTLKVVGGYQLLVGVSLLVGAIVHLTTGEPDGIWILVISIVYLIIAAGYEYLLVSHDLRNFRDWRHGE
jgi:uncharacterized membrane protein